MNKFLDEILTTKTRDRSLYEIFFETPKFTLVLRFQLSIHVIFETMSSDFVNKKVKKKNPERT